jgi:hypothetical protein
VPNLRREHPFALTFNGRRSNRVLIDQHYEENHPDMPDQLILELIRAQDGKEQEPAATRNGFLYFKIEDRWQGKRYRLILTYCEEDYLGVINAFRVKE